MMEVDRLSFAYGKRQVLRDASFAIAKGTVCFLLGANGAGKTTLIRCMLGLLSGYEGEIRIEGQDIRRLSPPELARRIAYIPQTHFSVFSYTALEVALMGLASTLSPFASPGEKERAIAQQALCDVGVEALAERPFQQLSGGEQQLVLIARALAQRSDILMMDEPTSSLDYGNQLRVLDRVCALAREGYTVLISSHNPQHAFLYADRVLALKDGMIARDGAPAEVMDEALLYSLYGVRVRRASTEYGVALLPQRGEM